VYLVTDTAFNKKTMLDERKGLLSSTENYFRIAGSSGGTLVFACRALELRCGRWAVTPNERFPAFILFTGSRQIHAAFFLVVILLMLELRMSEKPQVPIW
jgi:hypothetical protein